MDITHLLRLLDYNFWAHRRVWDCVSELTAEQFTRNQAYSLGSVKNQIVHTMGVERLLFIRAQGQPNEPILKPEQFNARADIRSAWDQIETDWRAYLSSLEESALEEVVKYISLTGNAQRSNRRWELVMQLFGHGVDHRAQTLAAIHQVGGRTIGQDFIAYTWDYPGL
jgi:uncharacterized damage-inducible protein DinB